MAIDRVVKEIPPVPSAGPGQVVSENLPQLPQPVAKDAQPAGDQVLLSGTVDARFQEIQKVNEHSSAQAGAIRETDRAFAKLGQKIDELKAPLEAIVKNFPPFTPGDQTRIKFLKEYASLRKEIDQLTFPAPPEVVAARKAQELPAPLSPDASDSQIADHLAKLDATGSAAAGARAALKADTAAFVTGGRFAEIFSVPNLAETGGFQGSLTEPDAAQKSGQVGRQFATEVSQGVTADSSQFLKGLS